MKVLLVAVAFPPAEGAGVERVVGFSTLLPTLGIETHVLAPAEPTAAVAGNGLPTRAWIHRTRHVGAPARSAAPARRRPLDRLASLARRLLPDDDAGWNVTAIPAAVRIVRAEGIDVVVTASPPASVHLVGAAAKRTTGALWVVDLASELAAGGGLANADAIACASDEVTAATRRIVPAKRVVTVATGEVEALAELVGSIAG